MSAATALDLAAAFGLPTDAKDVAALVKNFDFSKINVRNVQQKEYLNFNLAPSFGTLNSESVKLMDDKLKIIISGTTRVIAKMQDKSWANVLSALSQNPLLEPMDNGVEKSDKLIKNFGTSAFRFDGTPDPGLVREVETWFKNLIGDEDIINSTGIDINVLGRIVAGTGASVNSFEAFFAKNEYHEQTIIEIGVLRYPDIEHPYFKVYRIKLVAWSASSRILFIQEDKNGITGEFALRRYKPRESIIAGLKQETKAKAIQEAEDLFASF